MIVLPILLLTACSSAPEAQHDLTQKAATEAQHQHHHERPAHQHRFDDAEKWAKMFDDPSRVEWQKPDEVIQLMAIAPGMKVADIGAGTGYFLSYLSKAVQDGGHVFEVDIEPNLIDYMNKRIEKEQVKNATTVLAAPDDPHLEAGTIDRILIVDTWHHISNRVEYSKKLADALTADGQVFIVDFTKESPRGPPVEHRLTPEEVVGELREAGFEGEVLSETLPVQYVVVGRKTGS